MPSPTWDTPGLNWDSGLTWDNPNPTPTPKPRTMNNTKAIIDFTDYSATELGTLAQLVHDQLDENAATFPNPPLTLANFQTQITDYDTKLLARASRATEDVLAFNAARELMEETLGTIGSYVNTIAKGSAIIVEKSGLPAYQTTRTPDTTPPAAPQDLKLRHGPLSGTIVARYIPDRKASTNEVQANLSDPNTESAWQTKGIFQHGKADLTGFAPGIVVWVRVRTVGLKGVMGAWSDPAQIRTL